MVTRIKICGLTRKKDVQVALQLGAHALGFVFYPKSPRLVSAEQARELIALLPPFVTSVGLFVNATVEQVLAVLAVAPVNVLQFHGDETPEQCHAIAQAAQRPFIRALRVKDDMCADDLLQCETLYRVSSPWFSGLLLDSFVDSFGGSGKVFDWSVIPKELAPRVVLSGGLTAHNVSGAVVQLRPWAVDISSGVELAKGIKDPAKMRAFVKAVQMADTNLPENEYALQYESQSKSV
ncbi:phosphoribosylanthranilate isomerase [Solimicrobium silvestre]|uniref:N-(5'-phosphoribosyl)anthranilate isomerase n=1 Tax=Solimicrobium silvestre TaxID=2099400 RepID=A0A2S9GZL8_9BURK|nr:phosphoribosylanthranilate isomerase [Solimicrobium silvestre]PRC93157.1 Phosphoribosylanthranilate isomerase [Solimicrobium silvestre]